MDLKPGSFGITWTNWTADGSVSTSRSAPVKRYPTEALARKAVQALLLNLNAEAPRAELEVPSFGHSSRQDRPKKRCRAGIQLASRMEADIKTHIRPKWADYPSDPDQADAG